MEESQAHRPALSLNTDQILSMLHKALRIVSTWQKSVLADRIHLNHCQQAESLIEVGVGICATHWTCATKEDSDRSAGHDQYTIIVRSKPAKMVLNHPKLKRHNANRLNNIR